MVLYLMQSSQRISYNFALKKAIEISNTIKKPLIVLFVITKFPNANASHYKFMIEGLKEASKELRERKIKFSVKINEDIFDEFIKYEKHCDYIVLDKGYLKFHKLLYNRIFNHCEKNKVVQIEDNVVIPVEEASNKEEYSAATFRRKISSKIDERVLDFYLEDIKINSLNIQFDGEIDLEKTTFEDIMKKLKLKEDKVINYNFKGGYSNSLKNLKDFLENKIKYYEEKRNFPELDYQSNLSPYIHFGNISPLEILFHCMKQNYKSRDAFLEELIVRRELAVNFVYYNKNYDNIFCLNEWAYKTLKEHESDERKFIYSLEELENAKTHDVYWNAAQKEMISTGKMHGYMRMYWGKKIIEWTQKIEEAYNTAIYLNDKYELDGRDANGYTGIAWCFGKHDRAWKERYIFGKIRYMNDKGLERKFDIKKYASKFNGG